MYKKLSKKNLVNQLQYRYTAASNSCTLYGLLLRVQFGCLLQQLLLGAQIGLTHACARSFSSSCELCLSWLSQNACEDAREQKKKRRKLQNMGNSIADNDLPHAQKNARTILRKWFHFWLQIWDPVFGFSFDPRSFNSYCSAQNGAQNCSQNWGQNWFQNRAQS